MANSDFVNMEETARLISKSYGTVRLIVKRLRENGEFDKYCKKEGKQVLISLDYLRQNYDIKEDSDEIEFLRQQLREKDKQIGNMTEALKVAMNRFGERDERLYEFLGKLGIQKEQAQRFIEVKTIEEEEGE